MKTLFTIVSTLLLQMTVSKAQTSLPYYTGFDNTTQKAGWQEFRKGNADPTYKWDYSSVSAYSAPTCLLHNYPVGGTVTTDDWFVSPGFNLPAGGRLDSIRSAFSGFGMPAAADTVALYLLKGSPDPALATSKILLLDYRGANYSNDNTWRTNMISISPSTGSCYLAVRYKTVNNWLDVKFDNIRISALTSTSIHTKQLQEEGLVLYPNPASQSLKIQFGTPVSGPVSVKIYNTLGELQLEQKLMDDEALHFNLKNGTYFYSIIPDNGVPFKSGKLIVQNI